jgi:hypothetical protein
VNQSTRLFSALILAIYLSMSIFAQGQSPLFSQIEKAIEGKESAWKLVHRLVSKNGKYVSYEWKSGKSSVGVLIFVHDTPEQANKTYHNFDLEAFGLKRKVLEGTVLDVGDENYAWEDANDSRTTGIDFRKGKVFVHITAPTKESAKQFAFLIAETLPAT